MARALALCRPFAGRLALGAGLIVLGTAFTLPAPWLFKLLLDEALPRRDSRLLLVLLVAAVLLLVARALLTLVRNRLLQTVAMRLVCDLRIRVFAHLQTVSLRYFDRARTGETVAKICQDTGELYNLTNGLLINLVADTVTVLAVLVFLFWVEWRLALAACVVLPLFVLNYLHHRERMQAESRTHRQHWDKVVGFLNERIANPRVIKAFGREAGEVAEFASGINADYFNYSAVVMRNTKLSVVADTLAAVGGAVVLGYGGWLVMDEAMAPGTLVAFNAYLALVFPPLVRFVDLAAIFHRAFTGLENVFALLDLQPEVKDAPGARGLDPVRGEVRFERVGFDYRGGGSREVRAALTDVSLVARPGESIALVGPSGSGKSTLVALLARFYDPTHGRILIDGVDLRELSLASLRRLIAIVPQENVLFSGTIEDNLRYGRPAAPRDTIVAAAQAASAHDFILQLPDGYSTLVGERGAQLSGGQRQRIAIARALLVDPRILIFDEATSALDTVSERAIQDAMTRISAGRTVFSIAHRLSTVQNADRILVLDAGRIVESGTHADLLAHGGLYAHLHALQFRDAH
ncbi:ABC transporter ATP-binding protein [Oleiharenicola lentus]|uniref:ABC transporter ATP-binding protein n=2 Tax=Oleiharenicola lentus TaxID=2508720 RepID=A0A4Q1CCR2_9BACT|nr:ABC transporter ATP-binding protein [Oleiharenicola lentus]